MHSYNNDFLLFHTLESQKERLFNRKCRQLVNLYGAERILEAVQNLASFNNLFVNEILTKNHLNHILLKKYCVCRHTTNEDTKLLDFYIATNNFNFANDFISSSGTLRSNLLDIYISNMNYSNHASATEIIDSKNYKDLNQTLYSIDNFYETLEESSKMLKKVIR